MLILNTYHIYWLRFLYSLQQCMRCLKKPYMREENESLNTVIKNKGNATVGLTYPVEAE